MQQVGWWDYDIIRISTGEKKGAYSLPPIRYEEHLYAIHDDAVNDLFGGTEVYSATGSLGWSLDSYVGTKFYYIDFVSGVNIALREVDLSNENVTTLETISAVVTNAGSVVKNEDSTKIYYSYIIGGTAYFRAWDISGGTGAALTNRADVTNLYGLGVESDGTLHFGYKHSDTKQYWDEWTLGGGWIAIANNALYSYTPGFGGYTQRADGYLYPPGSVANSWDYTAKGAQSIYIHTADGGSIEAILMRGTTVYYMELTAGYTVTDRGSTALGSNIGWRTAVMELKDLSRTLYFAVGAGPFYTFQNKRRNLF